MRHWTLILWMSAAAVRAAWGSPHAEALSQWERNGRALFLAAEFKQASRAFEKAVAERPDSPGLYYWLGKSYARLAETASPLSAPKAARKARRSLEQAVRMDPKNQEYLHELFAFYVDSPEWFHGGLERASALVERLSGGDGDADSRMRELAESQKDHSGAGWWTRRTILWTSGAIGTVVPEF
jgi:tetratricopeptide (TPR) repeat protein